MKVLTRGLCQLEYPLTTKTAAEAAKRLLTMFKSAVFPDVYFVIRRLSSGGTVSDAGPLIGMEMYGRTDDPILTKMDP